MGRVVVAVENTERQRKVILISLIIITLVLFAISGFLGGIVGELCLQIEEVKFEGTQRLQEGLNKALYTLWFLTAFVILSGFVLIYQAQRLKLVIYQDMIELCDTKVGEIR